MARPEMPIFTRTFDFLSWLLPATNHFPRAHRHTFTQRLLNAAFDYSPQSGGTRFLNCLCPESEM